MKTRLTIAILTALAPFLALGTFAATPMPIPASFPAFRIRNDDAGYRAGIEALSLDDLKAYAGKYNGASIN